MYKIAFCFVLMLCASKIFGQGILTGILIDADSETAIAGAKVSFGNSLTTTSKHDGSFSLEVPRNTTESLVITHPDFEEKKLIVTIGNEGIDLGKIRMGVERIPSKDNGPLVLESLEESDDGRSISSSVGILQSRRDIFSRRAAFDFGQAFFRIRGLDSREGTVSFEGLPVNKILNGRPDWNNWGGLNDLSRNQTYTSGIDVNRFGFNALLGNTNISIRPSSIRKGTRLTTSASNRNYNGRLMATHAHHNPTGLNFAVSASRRWAKEAYIEGTLYDTYSFYAAVESDMDDKNSLALSVVWARNRRGRSAAITEEVCELVGARYNPYWGLQNGDIRNARERIVEEPVFILNHQYNSSNLEINNTFAYQFGKRRNGRLGYFDAPNPDPTYFRYLPSFYINNPIGADFTNAELARKGFLSNPQINWTLLYQANQSPTNQGKASYIVYDEVLEGHSFRGSSSMGCRVNSQIRLDLGAYFNFDKSRNYAELEDLLGAQFHEDIDAFSDTANDLNGTLRKTEGEKFSYNFNFDTNDYYAFLQGQWTQGPWHGFLSGKVGQKQFQRTGNFQNERFPQNSLGPSEKKTFTEYSLNSGLRYFLTQRHWFQLGLAYLDRAPLLRHLFINPRENNEIVPQIDNEEVLSLIGEYQIRLPKLVGRISGYYANFNNKTDINFFYVEAGIGSDFVQEVLTNLDTRHLGVEIGMEYEASPQVKLSLAANIGDYEYSSNPDVTINFDTAGAEENLIDPMGNLSLGKANIKGLKLAQGPQKAISFGIDYSDEDYWRVGGTLNHLTDNYIDISTITRTPSFIIDPETGQPFPDATAENVERLLRQEALDPIYLINVTGGKSWLIDNKYISLFISINNLFDSDFITGGYEQSRNGNYGQLLRDNLRSNPTFAPKHWYGFGRTYFINLSLSF